MVGRLLPKYLLQPVQPLLPLGLGDLAAGKQGLLRAEVALQVKDHHPRNEPAVIGEQSDAGDHQGDEQHLQVAGPDRLFFSDQWRHCPPRKLAIRPAKAGLFAAVLIRSISTTSSASPWTDQVRLSLS